MPCVGANFCFLLEMAKCLCVTHIFVVYSGRDPQIPTLGGGNAHGDSQREGRNRHFKSRLTWAKLKVSEENRLGLTENDVLIS